MLLSKQALRMTALLCLLLSAAVPDGSLLYGFRASTKSPADYVAIGTC